MKKSVIFGLCLFLFLGVATFAAEEAGVDEIISSGTNIDNYTAEGDKLKLNKQQREQLRKIKTDTQSEDAKLAQQRNKIRNEIRTMMQADDPDLGKIEAKIKRLEKMRTQVMINKLKGAKMAKKVLTKEQRNKMKQIRVEHRKAREKKIEKMKKKMRLEKSTPSRPTRTPPSRSKGRSR